MTEKQMNDMFSSMGYSPEVTYIPGPGQSFTDAGTFTVGNPDSPFHISIPYSNTYTSSLMVPQIKDSDSDSNKTVSFTKVSTPKNLAKTATPTKKGGGGSKKDKKKASDEIERYHEIKDTLESLEKQYDSISKKKDRAFGKEKLDYIDQEIAKTKELTKAQEQYIKEIEANAKKDKAAVEKLGAKIDSNGVITNYDELMNKLLNKFNNSARGEKDEEEYNKAKEIIKQ